jgi:hypothetical protein
MFTTVDPARMAMEGVHPVYNARDVRLTPLPNECKMVDLVWKADRHEASGGPDIPDRFFIYGSPDHDWSWLRTELFYRVEHLKNSQAYRY